MIVTNTEMMKDCDRLERDASFGMFLGAWQSRVTKLSCYLSTAEQKTLNKYCMLILCYHCLLAADRKNNILAGQTLEFEVYNDQN
jgi:hypothetical protein